jgi:hypothetical protein
MESSLYIYINLIVDGGYALVPFAFLPHIPKKLSHTHTHTPIPSSSSATSTMNTIRRSWRREKRKDVSSPYARIQRSKEEVLNYLFFSDEMFLGFA